MLFTTRKCPVCGQPSVLEVDPERLKLWQDGMLIQKAFPEMNADQRELLITGCHSDCWDRLAEEMDQA